jgi:general stress protein 26
MTRSLTIGRDLDSGSRWRRRRGCRGRALGLFREEVQDIGLGGHAFARQLDVQVDCGRQAVCRARQKAGMAASAPEPSAASQPAAATASAEDAPYVKSLRAAMRNNAAVNFSKLACLATVTAQGLPSVRTVVVRAVEGQRVLIASDARSAKVADLRRSPLAELCWYFPLTREQFRLRGRVEVWGAESKEPAVQRALLEIWKKLPENTRGLTSLPAPGTVRPDRVGLGDLDKVRGSVRPQQLARA